LGDVPKPEPEIVTVVPPAVDPIAGATDEMVGVSLLLKLKMVEFE
jgi:hypothetical protein